MAKPLTVPEARAVVNAYLVRHAWAGHFGDPQYPDDALRPLTDEGRKRFRRQMKRLVANGLSVDRIGASPLLRCVETAEIVAAAMSEGPPIDRLDGLAPGGDWQDIYAWMRAAGPDGGVALVGHHPDIGRLAAELLAGGRLEFTKGAIAAVQFEQPVVPGRGTLRWFVNARILGCF